MPMGKQHRKDHTGEIYNRLTILEDAADNVTEHGIRRRVNCLCSCGCWKLEQTSKLRTTHGLTKTPLEKKVYSAWRDIKRRCYQQDHPEYKRYGALGIKIQESWKDDPVAFCEYVSNLPDFSKDMSLDRIDNDIGYVEGNLRWATNAQQTRNQGKQVNNTSGACGVTWYYNDSGGTRAVAWWNENGKSKSKSFSVKKYGLLPAFDMACRYRKEMIKQLNSQGAGYSDKHGL